MRRSEETKEGKHNQEKKIKKTPRQRKNNKKK